VLNRVLPCRPCFSNPYRLDVVVDDYLQQAFLFNGSEAVAAASIRKLPTFVPEVLCRLPHGVRIDLSVLLTAHILFDTPDALFTETMEILLARYLALPDIHDLLALPNFVKTGVVSLLRRVCRRELEELKVVGFTSEKPPVPVKEDVPVADAVSLLRGECSAENCRRVLPSLDSDGFRFLKALRRYLSQGISENLLRASSDESEVLYSEMEMDLLFHLPDFPTKASCPAASSAAYREWVSLAARHTVILMTRAPGCPPLTLPQCSRAHTAVYKLMQPLLKASGMTYEDLEISTSGPGLDGRTVVPSGVLGFGCGVPDGNPKQLVWNSSELSRGYSRPWCEKNSAKHLEEGQELELRGGTLPPLDKTRSIDDDDVTSISSLGSDVVNPENQQTGALPSKNVLRASVRSKGSMSASDIGSGVMYVNSGQDDSGEMERNISPDMAHSITDIDHLAEVRPWGSQHWMHYQRYLSPSSPSTIQKEPRRVSGFSSDSRIEATFILAPEDKISLVKRLGMNSISSWNSIARAPVFIHPHSLIPVSTTTPPSDTAVDDDSVCDLKRAVSIPLAVLSRQSSLASEIGRSNSSVSGLGLFSRTNSLLPSKSFDRSESLPLKEDMMTPLERRMMRRNAKAIEQHKIETEKWLEAFNGDLIQSFDVDDTTDSFLNMTDILSKIGDAEHRLRLSSMGISTDDESVNDFTATKLAEIAENVSVESSHASEASNSAKIRRKSDVQGKEDLLKAMGTIRNVKLLSDTNKKRAIMLKKQEKRDRMKQSMKFMGLCSTPEYSPKAPKVQSASNFSWSSFVRRDDRSDNKSEASIKNSDVASDFFLTETNSELSSFGGSIPGHTAAVSSPPRNSKAPRNTANQPGGIVIETSGGYDATRPIAEQLREAIRYTEVYTLSNDIEWGGLGPSGKMGLNWYPKYPKVMYTLDPMTPMNIAREKGTIAKTDKTTEVESKLLHESLQMETEENRGVDSKHAPRMPCFRVKPTAKKTAIKPIDFVNTRLKHVEPVQLEAIPQVCVEGEYFSRCVPDVASFEGPSSPNTNVDNASIVSSAIVKLNDLGTPVTDALSAAEDIDLDSIDSNRVKGPVPGYNQERLSTPDVVTTPVRARTPSTGAPRSRDGRSYNYSGSVGRPGQSSVTVPSFRVAADGLPPLFNTRCSAQANSLVVQVDRHRVSTGELKTQPISVMKPASHTLKLSKSFKQPIPRLYRNIGSVNDD